MILPRPWMPAPNLDRLLAAMSERPVRRNIITKLHHRRGVQTRRNRDKAKHVLEKLGL